MYIIISDIDELKGVPGWSVLDITTNIRVWFCRGLDRALTIAHELGHRK